MHLSRFVQNLKMSSDLGTQLVHHHYLAPQAPEYAQDLLVSPDISSLVKTVTDKGLYSHQAEAIRLLKQGLDILVSTPTASGKSLIYNLPVIERVLSDSRARALYIFPLKALEQDQLKNLSDITHGIKGSRVKAAIYDGDTSKSDRLKIRKKAPNIIMTNPDMLHRGLLPYHEAWSEFFSNLNFVIIDEVHVYRGIFGSHLAQILRRLKRICSLYKKIPTFILSSATVQNPRELGRNLTGKEVTVVSKSGAPKSGQHFIFLNPLSSTNVLASRLFIQCLESRLRTIVFTQSRKATELINMWSGQMAPSLKGLISSYRAGFLPGERRLIEKRLARGEMLGVISTSALEMGIDIGHLDVCILAGYPGTIINTWQRGGRAGRSGRDSLIALVANQDALDQYFMRKPEIFFDQSFESAVIDPDNDHILRAHLPCAAAETPVTLKDEKFWGSALNEHLECLEFTGSLRRTSEGEKRWYATRKRPHLGVDIRTSGEIYSIFEDGTGQAIGTIDGVRAFRECHPGAVYLHRANTYIVDRLDIAKRDIIVRSTGLRYFTRIRSEKETEIINVERSRPKGQFVVKLGDLKVTETITGYEKRKVPGQELIGVYPLELPPQTFETVGLWVEIEHSIKRTAEERGLHFMGGIHAIEHAAISLFPLFTLCDRNDIGGISYTFHPQVGKSSVFIYDAYPGGVGLARKGFDIILELLGQTLDLIKGCPCEQGCPSCIYSPRCGSGNKPLDKQGAVTVLEALTGVIPLEEMAEGGEKSAVPEISKGGDKPDSKARSKRVVYFDLETQKSAEEVGGWKNAHLMMISVAVLFDDLEQRFYVFSEEDIDRLVEHLTRADLVIGFNVKRFDYTVLSPYTCKNLNEIPTFDILEDVHSRLGFRLSLEHLVRETLNKGKAGNALQALEWFKAGQIEKLTEYCTQDVRITRDLFLHAVNNGCLIYKGKKEDERLRLLVDWKIEDLINKIKG